MSSNPFPGPHTTATATAVLALFNQAVRLEVTAPVASIQARDLLELVQSLAEKVVDAAVDECARQRVAISCTKGCGACCVQLVPLAPMEARHLAEIVEAMPEPQRSRVIERFDYALALVGQAGLLETLMDTSPLLGDEIVRVGLEYFALGIPCPFLEDQSCSIHPDRPVRCREYLVTSSPEYCADPEMQGVVRVRIPAEVFQSMLAIGGESARGHARWVPHIVALQWAKNNPDRSPARPGTALVRELFEALSGKRLTAPGQFPI